MRFENVADDSLPKLFKHLRSVAGGLSDSGFWDIERGCDVQLSAVPNAAELVSKGQAEAFHFVATGIRAGAHELPDIGAFVARGEFALDYQIGPQWDESRFMSFLTLVCELRTLAPEARITTEPEVVDEFREAFELEVAQHCARHAAI